MKCKHLKKSTTRIGVKNMYIYFSNSSRDLGKVDKSLKGLLGVTKVIGDSGYNIGEENGERWKRLCVKNVTSGKHQDVHRFSAKLSTNSITWKQGFSPSNPQVFHREVA